VPTFKVALLSVFMQVLDSAISKASNKNAEFVGGPKVHFGDIEAEEADENPKLVGNFERKDTPHPKPGVQTSKLKKQLVDGHVIQHGPDVSTFDLRCNMFLAKTISSLADKKEFRHRHP
jgi:hypothetical protein